MMPQEEYNDKCKEGAEFRLQWMGYWDVKQNGSVPENQWMTLHPTEVRGMLLKHGFDRFRIKPEVE